MPLPKPAIYTTDDIYALPEGQRAELIDGQLYDMAPPNTMHQRIVMNFNDDQNYVEPDISVICDKNKLDNRGYNGAPDWVIEVTSPSNPQMDYGIKLFKYRTAGVREYWVVNPSKSTVTVFDFEEEKASNQYTFQDDISGCIFEDFTVNMKKLVLY